MQDTSSLRQKRALVTGAGTRLGQAIAIALGAQGMSVAVHYHHHREGADETVREIEENGGRGYRLAADLSARQSARDLVDRAIETLQGLDLLVASAANFEAISFDSITDDAWDRTLNLNLTSPFAIAQRASRELARNRGSIVFITCSSAVVPFRGHLPYVTAKAGLYQLMRAMALELAPDVRVNAVAPGFVLPPSQMPNSEIERIRRHLPLQRIGTVADVADAVVLLARSRFITGEQIVVDGGRSLARFPDGG